MNDEITIERGENAAVRERKHALLDGFARMLTGNLDHPAIVGGAYQRSRDGTRHNPQALDLARWSGTHQLTRRTASYLVGLVAIRPLLDTTRALRVLGASNCQPLINLLAESGWVVPQGQRPELLSNNDGSLTIVVPWPSDIQDEVAARGVSLDDLSGIGPANRRGRFAVSANTSGDIVTLGFGTSKAGNPGTLYHLLISGATGQGKTWFMLSLLAQLSQTRQFATAADGSQYADGPGAGIAVVDLKGGDGVSYMANFPNQLGPTVYQDFDGARAVLAWFFKEIKERDRRQKEAGARYCHERPLYLFLSEFTRLVAATPLGIADPASIFMLSAIVKEGRAFNIHVILDTQHIRGSLFGDTTTRSQFDDAVVFKPQGHLDSAGVIPAALGVNPYLTLSTPGDCYTVLGARVMRGFAIHASDAHLEALRDSAEPQMREWPEFDANDLEGFTPSGDPGRPAKNFDAVEIATALQALKRSGVKREFLRDELVDGIGNDRAKELMALARKLAAELEARGYCAPER